MTYRFRINTIEFNDDTTIVPGPVTVFIGPNNVGKSRILNDIAGQMTGVMTPPVVVRNIQMQLPSKLEDLTDTPHDLRFTPAEQSYMWHDLALNLCGSQNRQVTWRFPDEFEFLFADDLATCDREDSFAHYFGGRLVAHLTTETRLQLLRRSGARGYDQPSQALLHLLMHERAAKMDELQRYFRDAFHQELFLDYSALSQLSLRVLPESVDLPAHPRNLRLALEGVPHLDEQGDGMRAFAGVAAALAVTERPVVLIDEPETFLHPPQSRAIGKLIARSGNDQQQLFVATHSVDVLRGLLSAQRPTRIMRLTREGNANRLTELDPVILKEIAADPLKSSARVLDGLFHQAVAVVEGESDARFFGAVADQMGGDQVHFVSAGGKQATAGIIDMYRRLGVRCAAVLDFDALRDESHLRTYLRAHGVNEVDQAVALNQQLRAFAASAQSVPRRAEQLRTKLNELLEHLRDEPASLNVVRDVFPKLSRIADPWGELKRRGIGAVEAPLAEQLTQVLAYLRGFGLFIIPSGELESLLPDDLALDGNANKAAWVRRAIPLAARMAPDASSDPWRFVNQLLTYLGAGSTARSPSGA